MNLLFRLAPAIWELIWELFGNYLGTIWELWVFHARRPGAIRGNFRPCSDLADTLSCRNLRGTFVSACVHVVMMVLMWWCRALQKWCQSAGGDKGGKPDVGDHEPKPNT